MYTPRRNEVLRCNEVKISCYVPFSFFLFFFPLFFSRVSASLSANKVPRVVIFQFFLPFLSLPLQIKRLIF